MYCNKISAFPTFSVFWQDFLRLFDFSYFRILSRFVPFPSFSSFPISVFQQDALLTFPSFSEMFYDSFRLFLFPYFIKISAISTFPSFPFFSIALFPYFSCFPYFSIFSVFFVFSNFRILILFLDKSYPTDQKTLSIPVPIPYFYS